MLYDGSGNILALVRNGQSGSAIDALAYAYTSGTNRLSEVTDATGDYQRGASYGYYTYDADGALTRLDGSGATHDDVDTDLVLDRRKLPVLVSRFDGDEGVTTTVTSRYSASGERYAKSVSYPMGAVRRTSGCCSRRSKTGSALLTERRVRPFGIEACPAPVSREFDVVIGRDAFRALL